MAGWPAPPAIRAQNTTRPRKKMQVVRAGPPGLARFATPSCAISIPDFSLFKAYQLNRQKNKQKKIKACKIIINSPTAQYTVHFPFLAIYMYPTKLFSSPY